MLDSIAIDNALIAKLGADAALIGVMSNGVYWQIAPPSTATKPMTKFVIVSLTSSRDGRHFGRRSFEEIIYLVKAVTVSTVADAAALGRQAAARIDTLLDPQPPDPPAMLTVPGYTPMAIFRDPDTERVNVTEVDDVDPTIRWYHRGGHYRVVLST